MKNFYLIHETKDKTKRETILEAIKPICEVFGITDYDYILNDEKERLVVEGQEIGTRLNSVGAVIDELINYIWCETFASNRCLGAFEKQTMNRIKAYWK